MNGFLEAHLEDAEEFFECTFEVDPHDSIIMNEQKVTPKIQKTEMEDDDEDLEYNSFNSFMSLLNEEDNWMFVKEENPTPILISEEDNRIIAAPLMKTKEEEDDDDFVLNNYSSLNPALMFHIQELDDKCVFHPHLQEFCDDPCFVPPPPSEYASIFVNRVRKSGHQFFSEFPPEMTIQPFKYELKIISSRSTFTIESCNPRIHLLVEKRKVYKRENGSFEIRCIIQMKYKERFVSADPEFRSTSLLVLDPEGLVIGESPKFLVRSKRLSAERKWWIQMDGIPDHSKVLKMEKEIQQQKEKLTGKKRKRLQEFALPEDSPSAKKRKFF